MQRSYNLFRQYHFELTKKLNFAEKRKTFYEGEDIGFTTNLTTRVERNKKL